MSTIHNCCKCGKTIDTSKNEDPAQWFGAYESDRLKAVICLECIQKCPMKGDLLWTEQKHWSI